jgi:APA family basic amino acid/polyamine antiporter
VKRKTPVNSLILILIIMCGFGLIGDIETVARIANIFIFITFIVVNLSVIILRKKDKALTRPYRIPGEIAGIPVVPVIGVVLTLTLFGFNIYSLLAN